MTDEDPIYSDLRRLQALREEIADLAACAIGRLDQEDIDEACDLRDQIIAVVDHKQVFQGTMALCEAMYLWIEQMENESIMGFMRSMEENTEEGDDAT